MTPEIQELQRQVLFLMNALSSLQAAVQQLQELALKK